MAIQNASDSQKVDYLWKKIAYGATKTDIAGNIDATQEPFPSPLQIRADKILQNSDQIPGVIPGSNTSIVTVYTTSLPVECTSDAGIATPTLTWTTGRNFWIPPEFGSTYQVKVYISPSGQANNVTTKGTQVFATGSGNNDLWVFDYQSGILNFNSNNTPYNASNNPISFTGNSVYISGAVYAGQFGLPTNTNIANVILGNVTFSNTTISTSITGANLILSPTGAGAVKIAGTGALGLPSGTNAQRPTTVAVGYARFNTDIDEIEFWDGTSWITPGQAVITSDVITPDGTANTYSLTSNSTTIGVMVSVNGTMQQPYTAYTIVNNNQIQFTETPLTSDIIEVRHMAQGAATISSLSVGQSSVVLDGTNVNITGNLLPSANVTYSLGSSTLQWKDLWVSSNTVYIGGSALSVVNGTLTLNGNTVTPIPFSNVNVKAYTETMGYQNYGNVNVAAYTQTQSYTNYSNVNVQAYTESMGFANYSNVNVAAYTRTQSYTNYSNVNVAAYTQTQSYTNYSNVNLSAYLGGSFGVGTITAGTWSGTRISIVSGGTGATTATDALTNLLPSGAQTGYVLTTGGTGSYYWAAGSGGGGSTVGQSLTTLRQSNVIVSNTKLISLSGISYTPGAGQLRVYVNGVRQFPSAYTETSNVSYNLSANVASGDTVFTEIDAFSTFNNYANLTLASNVGNIAAAGLTVQNAIDSLENNKAPLSNPVFTGAATIGGNLTVNGNLFVNGNVTTINANNLSINDSMIYLADDNPADGLDIGLVSSFTNAVRYQHTGFVRDHTDGTWKLFANVVPEPTTTIDFTNATYSNLKIGNLTAVGATITGNIVANTAGYAIGYRDLPQVSTGNVTLALSDAGKHYYSNVTAPQTLTVPSNANVAFPIGTTIVIINRGTANITVAKQVEASMYLAGNTSSSNRTLGSYGMATLVKTETDIWFINGTGLT
jgi:hypothetical protein